MKKNTKEKQEISLLPHNQKLFNEIMELIKNGEHSIFYSEATGLGKSFIFMSLINELFIGKKVLYIVPKIAIWDNMNEYKEFKYIKDYVEMTTYADFNKMKIRHYDYDAIFIDECHHIISDIQGANIVELCNEYVEAGRYVFGFTATPEVGKINVDTYFNSKVYGMDIIQAIESGLFKKIEYAIADPDTVVDNEEYRKRYSIDGTKTLLENIIDERSDITRWLVYFSSISTLKKNLPSIKRLFPDYKIFIMHSEKNDNDQQLKEFNSCKEKSMLLTVSMVLEGIHPKKIGGILLYRNLSNHNVFLQVVGRVCGMNISISPLCVDITNCIYNIKKSYICNCIYDNTDGTSKSIKSIIDIQSSSYRYIDFIVAINNITGMQYRNITWYSDKDLCRKLHMGTSFVRDRKLLGDSYEKIIDDVLDGKVRTQIKPAGGSYRGITWKSDTDLSTKLGRGHNYVCNCRNNGDPYEKIIDDILDNRKKVQAKSVGGSYRGITWKNDKDLSIKLNMDPSFVSNRKKKGESYETIIDDVLDGKAKRINGGSYRGITWKSDTDLSTKLGKYKRYVDNCKRKGKSYETIIDDILDGKPKKYSYRGYSWNYDTELCKLLNKSRSYMRKKKQKGYTYKEIIDEFLDDESNN